MSDTKVESERKIPVTLITGFLGAGKTTFLNYILNANHGKKIAVIQNEYGQEIGIETAMVVGEDGSKVTEWLEFPNGCICCTVKDDFLRSIEELIKKNKAIDYILIESTGMGDPGQISSSLWVDEQLHSPIYLDSIITLVDAKNIIKQITLIREEEEKIQEVENGEGEKKQDKPKEAIKQIAFADIVLLNKIDLIENQQQLQLIKDTIKSINPLAKVITTERSVVDLDRVLSVSSYTPNLDVINQYKIAINTDHCNQDNCNDHSHNHSNNNTMHTTNINTICLERDGDLDLTLLNRWIGTLVWDEYQDRVYRMKGLVSVEGEQQKYILQGVYETFETLPSGINWKSDEKRYTRLVFIGINLDINILNNSLTEFLSKK